MWRFFFTMCAAIILVVSAQHKKSTNDKKIVDKTFIRFGRSPYREPMVYHQRLPKRAHNDDVIVRLGRNPNFMRFGKSLSPEYVDEYPEKNADDFARYNRAQEPELPKRKSQDFIRFGRSGSNTFMRFGKRNEEALGVAEDLPDSGYEVNGEVTLTHHKDGTYDEDFDDKFNILRLNEHACPDCYLE